MSKSIIQTHTDPLNRECFLCREEAGPFPELRHTGLHKHHFLHGLNNVCYQHKSESLIEYFFDGRFLVGCSHTDPFCFISNTFRL